MHKVAISSVKPYSFTSFRPLFVNFPREKFIRPNCHLIGKTVQFYVIPITICQFSRANSFDLPCKPKQFPSIELRKINISYCRVASASSHF